MNSPRFCIAVLITLGYAALLPAAEPSTPRPRPRLLIEADRIPAMRAACGLTGGTGTITSRPLEAAPLAAQLHRLREAAKEILRDRPRADDLYAPAVLHALTGQAGAPDEYSRYVETALLDPQLFKPDLDALVALDCCWEAIDGDVRRQIALRLLPRLQPLDLRQSPLEPFSFHPRLMSLAAALVLDDPAWDTQMPELGTKVRQTLASARQYFSDAFTRFCQQRGAMPTSGEAGLTEDSDLVLAVEIWRGASGESLWPELQDSLGRCLEHYFYADTGAPELPHGFVHDDGNLIPLRPTAVLRGFSPALPHLLAMRLKDPIAAWYARRAFAISGPADHDLDRYRWVPIVFMPGDLREPDRGACPLARDFGGGWVAMRSGWSGGDTLVLFDAGQPVWRSRQHFDAGQFQVYRRGRLAIDSGDDVALDAVPAKGGKTLIGGGSGDFDEYALATIAHNCVAVVDRNFEPRMYGRVWPAMGNQRLVEGNYAPTQGDVTRTPRQMGRLTAFETCPGYSYAAADLTPAYPRPIARMVERQVLFVHAGAVLVLDRVVSVRSRFQKVWNLHLPARPEVLSGAKSDRSAQGTGSGGLRQLHGRTTEAGIWQLEPDAQWMSVSDGQGRLFVRTLLPVSANRRLMGGPMTARKIPAGAFAEMTYFGGDPFGYEHRLWPSSFQQGPNAAYELGRPTGLGPQMGVGSTWGRYEVTPARDQEDAVFLHLLIPTDRTVESPPDVKFEISGDAGIVELTLGDQEVRLELRLDQPEGRVVVTGPNGRLVTDQTLTREVQPNAPIPLAPEDAAARACG